MKIGAIIVTYNAMQRNWIAKCLISLQNTGISEIIVIDNNSSDETCEYIKNNHPEVTMVSNKKNLGFGKANNIGLEIALKKDCDFFFLINQDAETQKETPQKLAFLLYQNPEFGMVSPLHLNGKRTALDSGFALQVSPNNCPGFYSDSVLNIVQDKIYETSFVCAATWMLSKEALKKAGGFNPTFYHYGEDVDYILRLQSKGLKAGIYPFCRIYHDRENRDPENNQYKNALDRNLELLKYSKPNSRHQIDADIQKLKIRKKIALLKFNKLLAKKLEEKIQFLTENKDNIVANKKIAESNLPYPFFNLL